MKQLTIITHAPQGTMGDPTLCAILAENLQKQHPDLKIKIVIAHVEKAGHWRSIDTIVKQNDNIEVQYLPDHIRKLSKQEREELFSNTDGIIVYPTFHFLDGEERKEIEEIRKKTPVIYITQYNFQLQSQYDKYNEKYLIDHQQDKLTTYEGLIKDQVLIETGIGKRSDGEKLVGVNLSDKELDKQVYLDGKDKSALNDSDTKSVRGILKVGKDEQLNNEALAKYKAGTDLYFGYYNNLPMEANTNWANASSFVKLAVLDSLQKNEGKKNIDIVIPLKDSEDSKKSGNNFEEIIKKLDLTQVTVEIWEKDQSTGELVKTRSAGTGSTAVRLISAFPFSKSTMDLMHRMSDPLTLMTGNSSISEAIEYDKIPLYQIMSWHTRLDKDLLAAISSDPPFSADHPYRIFHEIIRSDEPNKEEKLVALMAKHRNEILEGAKQFHAYVNQNYDLKENLPKEIDRKMQQQKKEIEAKITEISTTDSTSETLPEQFSEFHAQMKEDYDNFKNKGELKEELKNDLLLIAFMQNDLSTARKLLKQGADPNYTREIDGNQYNPLYFCIQHNINEKLLKELHDTADFDPLQGLKIVRETLIALDDEKPSVAVASYFDLDGNDEPQPIVVDDVNLSVVSYKISNEGVNEEASPIQESEEEPYVDPFEKLLDGLPKYRMIEMLIQSAIKAGKDPKDLFKEDEIREIYRGGVQKFSDIDVIYTDILIRNNIITIDSPGFFEVDSFYKENYIHKLVEKETWPKALMKFDDKFGLNLLEAGYNKYQNDTDFLKAVFLSKGSSDMTVLAEMMTRFSDNETLKLIASKILSQDELDANAKIVQAQEDLFKAKVAASYVDPDTSPAFQEEEKVKIQAPQTPILPPKESLVDINVVDLLQKLDKVALFNENAEKILYGEGALLSMAGYQYIRKMQLEYALAHASETDESKKTLKNIYLSPLEHPKLNVPVFIGENGEPICFYKDKVIDSGTFGQVYIGLRVDTGEPCIVKKQIVDQASQETQALISQKMHLEKQTITESVKDKSGKVVDQKIQYEAQKRVVGSNLRSLIINEEGKRIDIPEKERVNMSRHIVKALSQFHASGKLHRDLSMQNIMIDSKTKSAVLVDFGLTVSVGKELQHSDTHAKGMVLFRAPEHLSKKSDYVYNEQTEVYSLGVVLAILNSKQTTKQVIDQIDIKLNNEFNKDSSKLPEVIRAVIPEVFAQSEYDLDSTTAQLHSLIKAMTDPDPSKRPKLSDAVDLLDKIQQAHALEDQNADIKKSLATAADSLLKSIDIEMRESPRKRVTFSYQTQRQQSDGLSKNQARQFASALQRLSSKQSVSEEDLTKLMKDIGAIQNPNVKKQVIESLSHAGLTEKKIQHVCEQMKTAEVSKERRAVSSMP